MSELVTSEIFRLFFKTLSSDDKYSRRNMQIFWEHLQTPWPEEGKPFCAIFFAFLKCAWNLEHSETNKNLLA